MKGGCAQGLLSIIFYDGYRILGEFESWLRDIVDTALYIIRFVVCLLGAIIGTFDGRMDEIMADVSDNTMVDTLNRPRFVPDSKYPSNVHRWDSRITIHHPESHMRILYTIPPGLIPGLRKRERIDDRLEYVYTPHEIETIRCMKRGLEVILYLVFDFFKAWYYFFPLINKFYGRLVEWVIKIVFTFVREFIWGRQLWGIDPTWCYTLDSFIGLTGSSYGLGPFCAGNQRFVFELAMDVGNVINEDSFVEVVDFAKWCFFDHDNRISNLELSVFSNVTYVKAADSPDHMRYDKTARIDQYYKHFAAMIQCNENYESHDTQWDRLMLTRTKWEWCQAVSRRSDPVTSCNY